MSVWHKLDPSSTRDLMLRALSMSHYSVVFHLGLLVLLLSTNCFWTVRWSDSAVLGQETASFPFAGGRERDSYDFNSGQFSPEVNRFDFRRNFTKANYFILAPQLIQPESIFKIIVHTFESGITSERGQRLDLHVSILKDGVELRGATKSIDNGDTTSLELQIPSQLTNGTYKLLIEGNRPGSQGGTVFHKESNLTYTEKFLSILIQTNRPVYTGDQTVRFRCILLKRDLQPYGQPVTVFMLDSRGYIMRKWPSVPPKFGVVELSYDLPEYSDLGNWTIRVQAGTQTADKLIRVEKYYKPFHEVTIGLAPFILATDETFTATVAAFYGTEKGVTGNGTARVLGKVGENQDWILLATQSFHMYRTFESTWELKQILQSFAYYENLVIRVEADVKDYFLEETRSGFSESRILQESMQLSFLTPTPLVFKPGLHFQTYLRVCYSDFQKVPTEILKESHVRVVVEALIENGGRVDLTVAEVIPVTHAEFQGNSVFSTEVEADDIFQKYYNKVKFQDYWNEGILQVKFKVPKRAGRLVLRADYSDQQGHFLSTQATAHAFFSPTAKYIKVLATKSELSVGEYAILQFSATFFLGEFHYVVISKGLILQAATIQMDNVWSVSRSFSVPVSSEMAPGFRVLVYHLTQHGETLSDEIFVPVQHFSQHKLDLSFNQIKDKLKDSLEVRVIGDAGSYFALSAQRSLRHYMQAGNELSRAGVLTSFYSLESSQNRLVKVLSRVRSGEVPDQIQFLQSMGSGQDSARTFSHSNVLAFTDGHIPLGAQAEECENIEACGRENCYSYMDHCGRIRHCEDRTPLQECDFSEYELVNFRVNRTNRYIDFYDPITDGDWGWINENIGPHGNRFRSLDVPKITDTWHITGFSISPDNGFTLIDQVTEYDSTRPFLMALDAPAVVRRGEQVGIIAMLFNNSPKDIFATVILHASDDYVFVKLGRNSENSIDESQVHLLGGEHHHLVWIAAGDQLEVRVPVKPVIDQGSFEVTITATTQIRSDTSTLEISVTPEGAVVGKHTAMLLDLKNRATVLKFLDIAVEESPILPNDPVRKYIYGSPTGHVAIYGDVLGPIFPSIPIEIEQLTGIPGVSTADRLFYLSMTVWSLHYLRLTNQLQMPSARKVLSDMNRSFAHIMKRFDPEGWFKMWDISRPSVWLSAWALQVFCQATFQDWENYFLIEESIFSQLTRWLIGGQAWDGTFPETVWYFNPLNKKMSDKVNSRGPANVSLTAHVALAIHQAIPFLDGQLKLEANLAKNRAIQYLEKSLYRLEDPFQVALVTYLLTLADSPEKDTAFSKLFSLRTEDAGFLYWSPGPIAAAGVIYENQRPFTQAKNNEYWDAYAVEATSYALMVHLMRDGVTPAAEQIVTWLNTMKLTDGAFVGSLDTAVAFQALTEYANRARLREITDMVVSVELTGSANTTVQDIRINSGNIAELHIIDISEVWGHVNIIARGSGQAVVQLDVTYGVEWEQFKDTPPTDCFDLQIREIFSPVRNKSELTIESCFRWTLLEESSVSGTAVLDIEIPSGYGLVTSEALDIVVSGVHPTLRDAVISPGKTSWYFDYIPADWTCFNHTVRRWYPVANLTATRQASLYEPYSPERFVKYISRDTSSYELRICQVCGSFQCPYCPFFSRSQSLPYTSIILLAFCTLLALCSSY